MFIAIFVNSYVIVFNKKLWIWKFLTETINVYITLLNIFTKSWKATNVAKFSSKIWIL